MDIKRLFTADSSCSIFGIDFKEVQSQIKYADGETLFKNIQVEVPCTWKQASVDILAQKFLKKDNVPAIVKNIKEDGIPSWLYRSEADYESLEKLPTEDRFIGETSAKQIFRRIVGAWTYSGIKEQYFSSEEEALVFFEEMQYILCHQIASPDSLQYINTGLYWAYGISGISEEHYSFDVAQNKILSSTDTYKKSYINSCFIQSIDNNFTKNNSIIDLVTKEAKLFQYTAGTGTNFSSIRSDNNLENNSFTGLINLIKISDMVADSSKSMQITKDAPKIIVLNEDHPDIETFIDWKTKEEQKLVSLVAGSQNNYKIVQLILQSCRDFNGLEIDRYDIEKNSNLKKSLLMAKSFMIPEKYLHKIINLAKQGIFKLDFSTFITAWNSESYHTVAGYNSKTAINLNNSFLHNILSSDNADNTKQHSKKLWDKLVYNVWCCASPSIHFNTTINEWHTCPQAGNINASSPNTEFLFLDNTACSLSLINLIKFRKDNGTFNTERFIHTVKLLTLASDISISMAQFPSEEIAYLSYKFRPLGIGHSNIGAYLMSIGVPYDSDEGRNICAAISSLMTATAYHMSSMIAKKNGSFLGYAENSQHMMRVIKNHKKASKGYTDNYEGLSVLPSPLNTSIIKDKNLVDKIVNTWEKVVELGEQHGFKNAQVTSITSTSSTNILMDCSTTGIDPDFSLVKYKNITGGLYSKTLTDSALKGLEYLGYSQNDINSITTYATGHKTLKSAPYINHNTLTEKGFTNTELEKIEKSLPNILNIEFAFNHYILGEDFCINILKLDRDSLKNPNFSLLSSIGFNQHEITEASLYVSGHLNIENCSDLKREHINIFDCANICGTKGSRSLSYMSHIKMLAATQPFISGGIAKIIPLPATSTIIDCSDAHMLAWELGAKSSSLYVDESKLSQPIQTSIFKNDILKEFDVIQYLFDNNVLTYEVDDE